MELKAKNINQIGIYPEKTFYKFSEEQKTITRAGELWRKINIYSVRNLIKPDNHKFKCPKCNIELINIFWEKKGMKFMCQDSNCNFEYPN